MFRHSKHARALTLATASAVALSAALAAGMGAQAQDDQDTEDADRIVVTGSRIQRPDYTANSPIVTIDTETFENTSTIGLETVLNQLPQFIPAAFTQFNTQAVEPNPFATPGSSNVSLRGLGANRNLVLVDGRRVVPINASNAVDTNSIPSSAVQRVEIISGGASAVYGADAVGGVVNLILKDDFEGLEVDSQYGISELGDGAEFRVSALFGANSPDGRGNVMFGGEHSSRGEAWSNDRDWFAEQLENPFSSFNAEFWFSDTFYQPNALPGVTGPTGAPVPQRAPTQDAVNAIFGPDGLVHPTSNFFINRSPSVDTATIYTGGTLFLIFNTPNSTASPIFGNEPDGADRYTGPIFQDEYPNGPIWRKTMPNGQLLENQLANFLSTPLERYSMFGRGKYDVTDSVTATFDARFAQTNSRTLLQYSPAANGWGVLIPYGDEVYAPSLAPDGSTRPEYRTGGAFGLDCPAMGGCTESQAFPVPTELAMLLDSRVNPDGSSAANDPWHMSRNLDFLPRRQTANRTSNYQLTFGLEGELPNDWYWDAALSYGQADGLIQSVGFASLAGYRAIVTSPNYGRAFFRNENPGHGTFAAGAARCTSGLPIVEDFEVSEDCIKALSVDMQETQFMQMTTAQANITGDLFELPAGPLSFALGAEYREQAFEFRTDPQKSIESFTDQAIGIFPAGSTVGDQSVQEIYGELLVPVVRDLPGARHLNLELGGRYSDYNDVGGVETYKAMVDWLFVDFARFRGGYNRANRAPNIGELYQARTTQAFAPAGVAAVQGDPCNPTNWASPVSVSEFVTTTNPNDPTDIVDHPANANGAAGAAHARAICEALMGNAVAANEYYSQTFIPPGHTSNGAAGLAGQAIFVGNPNLEPETADTFTAGVVMTSPFDNPWTSGLQMSVDWYDIRIEDLIGQTPIDSLFQECLGLNTNPNRDVTIPACQALKRNQVNGNAQEVEVPYNNNATIRLGGVDLQINYTAQFADLGLPAVPGGFNLNVLTTVPTMVKFRASDTAPVQTDYIGTQANPPQTTGDYYDYRVFTTLNYFTGPWSATLRWQHYPSIDPAACQSQPTTCNRALGVPKKYDLFGLSGSYRLNDTIMIRAGVDNLFDTEPPLSGGNPTGTPFPTVATRGAGGGVYDPIGRRFFIGTNITF